MTSRLVVPAAVLTLFLGAAPASAQKIGYINSNTILQEAPGAKEARDQLDREMAQVRIRLQQAEDSLRVIREEFDRQQLTLSATARQQREAEINQRIADYQRRFQEAQEQVSRRQDEVLQPIMGRVNQVIDQIRREGDYSLIFDTAAGVIIAADPALDLTSEVIRRLRATAPSGPGGPRR